MGIEGKKILYLITQSHYGGAQKYVLQLANYFKATNQVTVAIGEARHQDPTFLEEARSLGLEPMVVSSLMRDISLVKSVEALLEIRKLLYKIRPDILHINSSMAGAIGSCAAWFYNLDPLNKPIRVIYTAHGFVFNEPMSAWRKRLYIFIEKISAGWKNCIITVSGFDKQQALQYSISHERKLRVIHIGTDAPAMSFLPREDARRQLNIKQDITIVGAIASLYKTKGLEYLVEAANQIPSEKTSSVTFAIVGEGPERKHIESQISQYGLNDRFLLLGSKKNASRYLNAFDIFVLPSVKEGFSVSILEAGAAKLPVVATRVGGVPEIIENEKTGILVPAQQPQALVEAIRTLLANPQQAAIYANALYEKITREFTLSEMLKKTSLIYKEITAPAPRKA